MKKWIVVMACTLSVGALSSFTNAAKEASTYVAGKTREAKAMWLKTEHDFGSIPQHKPLLTEFTFTNTSEEVLIIASVKTSCGCTLADYPKEALKPGESGIIKTTYDAARLGVFNRTVTVVCNNEEGNKTLSIKGEVVES
jgi:hypothetical protein